MDPVEFELLAEHVKRAGCFLPPELGAYEVPGESPEARAFRLTNEWLSSWESLGNDLRAAVAEFFGADDERAAIVALIRGAVSRALQGGRQ